MDVCLLIIDTINIRPFRYINNKNHKIEPMLGHEKKWGVSGPIVHANSEKNVNGFGHFGGDFSDPITTMLSLA